MCRHHTAKGGKEEASQKVIWGMMAEEWVEVEEVEVGGCGGFIKGTGGKRDDGKACSLRVLDRPRQDSRRRQLHLISTRENRVDSVCPTRQRRGTSVRKVK